MSIILHKVELHVLNMKARLPFKYGIATLSALPHLFVTASVEINGILATGNASDGLAPKWFTKNPKTSFEYDIQEMIRVIQHAADCAQEIQKGESIFSFWQEIHQKQDQWGKEQHLPSLLVHFGTSLIERALISAFCSAMKKNFHRALIDGDLGFQLSQIHPELSDDLIHTALPTHAADSITIRHTVGLSDSLLEQDISEDEKVRDSLPQSLQENIQKYGLTHFKIKLSGDLAKDRQRLLTISVIAQKTKIHFTLDGNEFFTDVRVFQKYWGKISQDSELLNFMSGLLFVEQPFHRDISLSEETGKLLKAWDERPLIIIDESDGDLYSAKQALELGYAGTSHKNCKGIFKGIANACLMTINNGILSGEDLCNVGPVALIQDLTVMASLGIKHVERNGHHYMKGLSMFPKDIQQQVMRVHGDLYEEHEGFPSLKIANGKISCESINQAPFGLGFDVNCQLFTPIKEWKYSDLEF